MRFRTFAWLAAAVVVIAGNTAILLWRKADRVAGPSAGRGSMAWGPTRVAETPAPYRPADASAVERVSTGGARLLVMVTTTAGAPLAGARVRATGDRPGTWSPFPVEALAEGTTGQDGALDLSLPRRTGVRVRVERDGFGPEEVVPTEGVVLIRLGQAGSLRVRLLDDATGAPLAGVAIRALRRDPSAARPSDAAEGVTDADGACFLPGLREGRWSVARIDPSRNLGSVRVGSERESLEFRLKRDFRLRGRVVVPGFDRPIEEGRVAASYDAPPLRRFEVPTLDFVPLDAEGRFVLGGFDAPPRSAYFLRVETGGQAYRVQGQIPTLDSATGEQVGEIQVPIPGNNPDASFSGTVRDGEGRPVAGAIVLLGGGLPSAAVRWMKSEIHLDEAWTDENGAWRLLPRYPGTAYRELLVLHPDFAPRLIELPERMRRKVADAVLDRGVTALVLVCDASGQPVAGAEVVAKMTHPDPTKSWQQFGAVQGAIRAWPRTDAAGLAAVERLGTGSWYLAARSADGIEGATALVEVRPGGTDFTVRLTLAPLPVVSGMVRVRGGSLPPGACVMVPGESFLEFVSVPIDRDGRFESSRLAIPACFLVDGRVPIFMPDLRGLGEVLALAEPGVPIEIEVDAPQAR